jgi:hypothetical protein
MLGNSANCFSSGVTVYTPTNIQNQSHVIAMFESGAGVEVIENKGHMTVRVYLPMTFLVCGIHAVSWALIDGIKS